MVDEKTGQETQKNVQENESISEDAKDYQALYSNEIENAKRLRKRAQEAESRIAEFEDKAESERIAKMKDDGEKDTLITELESKLSGLEEYKTNTTKVIDNFKTELLEKVPEEDRERISSWKLDDIQFLVSKLESIKVQNPKKVVGAIKSSDVPDKKWTEMGDAERRKHWDSIVESYNN